MAKKKKTQKRKSDQYIDPLGDSIKNNSQFNWETMNKKKYLKNDEFFPNQHYHLYIDTESDRLGGILSFEEWENRFWLNDKEKGKTIEPVTTFDKDKAETWKVTGKKKPRK